MKIKKNICVLFTFAVFTMFISACNSPKSYVEKGKKIMQKGDFQRSMEDEQEALEYFNKAIEKDPTYAPAYLERGKYYLQAPMQDFQALQDLQYYVELKPDDKEAWGLIMKKASDGEQKMRAAQKVLELEPENPTVFLHLGDAYMQVKNFIQAKKYLNKHLEKNPKNSSAFISLGIIALHEGRYYDAYNFFGKANSEVSQMHAVCHIKNLARGGDAKAQKFLAEQNISQKSYVEMAKDLVRAGKSKEARDLLSKIIMHVTEKSPNMAAIYSYYAKLKFNSALQGEFDSKSSGGGSLINPGRKKAFNDVVRLCNKSVDILPGYEAYKTLADAYRQLGEDSKSKSSLVKAAKHNPNSNMLYYDMALADLANENYNEAIQNLNKVINSSGKNAMFLNLRGEAYMLAGNLPKAREDFNESLKISPDNYNGLRIMVLYNMEGNSYTNAFTYLQTIAQKHGKFLWMRELVKEIPENYQTTDMKKFINTL